MTMAIAHTRGNTLIVDLIRERRAPFSPDDVVKEFAITLKAYGIGRIHGDRYAAEWPRERFRVHGLEYRVADKAKSELYLNLLPLLNSGRVELLDHPRLVAQLCGLERRTSRSGKDSIDHVPGGHDDVANAVAGAAVLAAQAAARPKVPMVALAFHSKQVGWIGAGAESPTGKTTTQLFYENGGGHGSWPGSDPFAREW
jgi:hypothetical protein